MKGDFSKWDFNHKRNFNGVLHQQGKVLLDSDWNAQTEFTMDWQDQAGRDTIGADVGAVPVTEQDSFKIHSAGIDTINNSKAVVLKVGPGRIWADGLLTRLSDKNADNDGNVSRVATYFGPPLQDPQPAVSTISNGVKDAVVLEVWREAVNGFQMPNLLIEPALGGVDTTERVQTAFAFRLLRLGKDENCKDVAGKVKDDISKKGKLAVSLSPAGGTNDDCPTAEKAGYSGFEHHLYRIEIARVNSGDPMFKWSQFNGGLVGRGKFDSPNSKVIITKNRQAITTSGLDKFYLEAVQFDPLSPAVPGQGHWRVTYGAEVTLNDDNELDIGNVLFGSIPAANGDVFFRLWNGIEKINDFEEHDHEELRDGIRLDFQDPASKDYIPGDYWTFDVRVGDKESVLIGKKINNDQFLGEPPAGIQYHRVPLAVLHWDADKHISFDEGQIDDCREIFRPLTNQDVCCSFIVGDGKGSHGDFDCIEEALRHLPKSGGIICLLPGIHEADVLIEGRRDIIIRGCGKRTVVRPRVKNWKEAIFKIKDSKQITLENMAIASPGGAAVVMKETKAGVLSEINIRQNHILALVHAVYVEGGEQIIIRENKIRMLDKAEGEPAIFILAEDSLIERNDILIVAPDDLPPQTPDNGEYDPFDDCPEPEDILLLFIPFIRFLLFVWDLSYLFRLQFSYKTPGGIQIGATSERIRILENLINGGAGNGITLGHIPRNNHEAKKESKRSYGIDELEVESKRKLKREFYPFLKDIVLEENRIQSMGLNGIGVINFFNLRRFRLMVSVEDLTIYRNSIKHCLQQVPDRLPSGMKLEMGYGGISLADTENCVIRENRIENNGRSHIEPVSGIFIFSGEAVDISDNRILNNAPATADPGKQARPGVRGGIVINTSFKKAKRARSEKNPALLRDGIPAVKIHDNIVTQPLGQALAICTLGPVSIVGNSLTSQDADLRSNPLSKFAATVLIQNLGQSKDQLAAAVMPKFGEMANANISYLASRRAKAPEFDLTIPPLLYLPNGNVLFANNQVSLDLRDDEVQGAWSSQSIISLDDVAYVGNQSECTSILDKIITHVDIKAFTIRANDNRFQEGFTVTECSLFSYGIINTCTTNQATHCLYTYPDSPPFGIKGANIVLFNQNCDERGLDIKKGLNISSKAAIL